MGLFDFVGRIFSSDARHNHDLYKSGRADKSEVRYTTVGWRRDPWNGEDGYTPDPGNFRRKPNGDCDTPSGQPEYYRVVRKAKR